MKELTPQQTLDLLEQGRKNGSIVSNKHDGKNNNYYDIESLSNIFTLVNFRDNPFANATPDNDVNPKSDEYGHADVFILEDDGLFNIKNEKQVNKIKERIWNNNPNFQGTISVYDLHNESAGILLSKTFGCSDYADVTNPVDTNAMLNGKYRLTCITDKEYDIKEHPFLMGYNSFNYDTTMLALFFYEAWDDGKEIPYNPPTAKKMREHNDMLFTSTYKQRMYSYLSENGYDAQQAKIRQNMLRSGRHLDVARLNEKQVKVALKRLLGMLGYQILESDKLGQNVSTIKNFDELCELVAYNVSDCVNLRELFYDKTYISQFELKRQLAERYPEVVYARKPNAYKADKTKVRRDRLNIDSSSAQYATQALCPYDHIVDIPVVSYLFPTKDKAEELGIEQVNVLDSAKEFFHNMYPDREDLHAEFDRIYNWYKSIEGKNYNDSKNYHNDYQNACRYEGACVHKTNNNTCSKSNECSHLVDVNTSKCDVVEKGSACGLCNNGTCPNTNGHVTTCKYCGPMPVFKLQDIEKADAGLPYFDKDGNPTSCYVIFSTGGVHGAEYNKDLYDYDCMKYNNTIKDMDEVQNIFPDPVDLRKAKTVTLSDGRELPYKTFLRPGLKIADSQYRDLTKTKPQLFKKTDKGTKLNVKYCYTSAEFANHEDFKSYYPSLLTLMKAFYNDGLGYDRYAEIFDLKEKYGKQEKAPGISAEEKERLHTDRDGTKLILNSASGAADALFENNIRANNQIISMRIIGQLFSWRIGQAQTAEGAKIISTNTDGLYSVMDSETNNEILEREAKNIGVLIEPEPMFLISKDTNNRVEFSEDKSYILSSSGDLGCHKGPDPTKALSHPAIIDNVLTEYLKYVTDDATPLSLYDSFNYEAGMTLLKKAANSFNKLKFLLMFQNIVASSPSTYTFIYGTVDENPNDFKIIQHYNRMFILKDGTPNTMHLHAAKAKVVTEATKNKRQRDGLRPTVVDDRSKCVLEANGSDVPQDRDICTNKVTNIDPKWYIYICNKYLKNLSVEEFNFIKDNIDYDKYLDKIASSYNKNWRNIRPGETKDVSNDKPEETEESTEEV